MLLSNGYKFAVIKWKSQTLFQFSEMYYTYITHVILVHSRYTYKHCMPLSILTCEVHAMLLCLEHNLINIVHMYAQYGRYNMSYVVNVFKTNISLLCNKSYKLKTL